MATSTNSAAGGARGLGKRNLFRLRRGAGYRTARDFADALRIPASTYSRYERAAEGPSCGIPLSSAWAMADLLGCSIDAVVGREDIDSRPGPTLDERVAGMNVMDREIVRSFVEFVESRNGNGKAGA